MTGCADFNYPAFFEAAKILRKLGHDAENPADNDGPTLAESLVNAHAAKADGKTWHDYMRRDLPRIARCDGMVMLDGWQTSRGASLERDIAIGLEMPVYRLALKCDLSPKDGPHLYDCWRLLESEEPCSAVDPVTGATLTRSSTGEVRVVDPKTGGEKGSKPAQLGAIDPASLLAVATVAGFGAQKYARYNYLKGYAWSLSFDAMQRHLLAFWSGQDNDEESGLPHAAHAAWHCLALLSFGARSLGTDDRPPAIER